MKNIELGLMIEKHRPPYALSSLPFVLEDIAGRVKVCWFNYYLDQCDDMFTVFIPDIYTLDKNKKIYRDNTEIKIITGSKPYKKPKVHKKRYYSKIKHLFSRFNYRKMDDIIMKSETNPLITAYKAVYAVKYLD